MEELVADLNGVALPEAASPEDAFLALAKRLCDLLAAVSSLVRHAEPGADLSALFLYLGTMLPEVLRRAAMQTNSEAVSRIVCAALEVCGSLLVQQQGTEGILALTRILLGEGPPLDEYYAKFGKPIIDQLAGQSFYRWPHDDAAVLARGRAMIGRPLRSKKGTVVDFDLATRTFTIATNDSDAKDSGGVSAGGTAAATSMTTTTATSANVELSEDVDSLGAFYSEISSSGSSSSTANAATLKLLVPPSPNVALGKWLLCRTIEENTVITEEGELIYFPDLSKERFKPMTAIDANSDPLAAVVDAVVKSYASKPSFTFVQLPSARLMAMQPVSWYMYSHIEALGMSGGIDGIAWTAATIPDLSHVLGALERLEKYLKASRALALASELIADLEKREYDLRHASVGDVDATLQKLAVLVDRLGRGKVSLVPHRLSTLLKFVTGPSLPQRLQAVGLVIAIAEAYPEVASEWVTTNQALERMLSVHVHVEIIRRTVPFVDLLAKRGVLSKTHLVAIWDLARVGESDLTKAAYSMLVSVVPLISPELYLWLFNEHICKIPPSQVDQDALKFVRDYCVASPRFPVDAQSGLDLLFGFTQGQSLSSSRLCRIAVDILLDMAALVPPKQRLELVDRCIACVLQFSHVAPCLLLVQGLIRTFPSSAETEHRKFFSFSKPKSLQTVIAQIDSKHKLLAHMVNSMMDKTSQGRGFFSLEEFALIRLEFIGFLLTNSSLKLSEKLVESLWNSTVINAASPKVMEIGVTWFGRAHGPISQSPMATPLSPLFEESAPLAPFNPKKAALSRSALSAEAEAWLVAKGLGECKFDSASMVLCDVVVDYVLSANRRAKTIRAPSPTEQDQIWLRAQRKYRALADAVHPETRRLRALDSIERLSATELVGGDVLWRLALEANDPAVARWAGLVAAQLHLPTNAKLDSLKQSFCMRCIDKDSMRAAEILHLFLKRAAKQDSSEVHLVVLPPLRGVPGTLSRRNMPIISKTGPVLLKVDSAATSLGALRKIIVEALDMPPKRTSIGLRVVALKNDDAGAVLPSSLDEDSVASLCLPSSTTLQVLEADDEEEDDEEDDEDGDADDSDSLQSLSGHGGAGSGGDADLLTLEMEVGESFDSNPASWTSKPAAVVESTQHHQLSSVLPIAEALIKRIEAGSVAKEEFWRCLLLLPNDDAVLEHMKLQQWDAHSLLPSHGLSLILHLQTMRALLLEQDAAWVSAMLQTSAPAKILAAYSSLNSVFPHVAMQSSVLPLLMSCTTPCLLAYNAQAKAGLLTHLFAVASKSALGPSIQAQAVALASQCLSDKAEEKSNWDLGAHGIATLLASPQTLNDEVCGALFNLLQSHAELYSQVLPSLGSPLLAKLIATEAPVPSCVYILLALVHGKPPPSSAQASLPLLDWLCTSLQDALKKQPSSAVQLHEEALVGLLRVLRSVVGREPVAVVAHEEKEDLRYRARAIIPLLVTELFSSHERQRLSSVARDAAYYLLLALGRNPKCLLELFSCIEFVAPTTHMTSWGFDPSLVRHPMQYTGLENLGTTCYVNSLLQQMAHVPSYAADLLTVTPTISKQEAELLCEVQTMFYALWQRKGNVFEPKAVCGACKDYDGSPIDVMEQKDVQEFSDILFTRLEKDGAKQVLETHFGGSIAQTTTSEDPAKPYRSEVTEPFYMLPISLGQGNTTLLQGFDALARVERLVGDSKLELPSGEKVNGAMQRVIKSLPPHLLVMLKRFEFNYETMTKQKLDDYCSFPHQLDLTSYAVPGQDKSYYQYELSGILVHAGGPDSGHYYSFIRERMAKNPEVGRCWYEFNDNIVWPYASDRIPHDCFGGMQTVERPNGTKVQIARPQSAYVLVYDRVGLNYSSPVAAAHAQQAPVSSSTSLDSLFSPMCALFILSSVRQALADPDPAVGLEGFKTGVRFFVEVLARAAPPSRHLVVHEWIIELTMGVSSLLDAARWLIEILAIQADSEGSWMLSMLFQCPDRYVRHQFCELVVVALHRLINEDGSKDIKTTVNIDSNDVRFPAVYRLQGVGPKSRIAWIMDALMVCASCKYPSDEYFDILLSLCKIDDALVDYLLDHGALTTMTDLFIRGADDRFAMQRHFSARHSMMPYRKTRAREPQYRPNRSRPLPQLVLLLVQHRPDGLGSLADAVVDTAAKRRYDDIAAALASLVWPTSSIISKLLSWAKRRPSDVNVMYEYAMQTGRQSDVANALIFAVDEMLQDGGEPESFYNLFVFQATRALYRLEGSKPCAEDLKRNRKKLALWPKNLAKKFALAIGSGGSSVA